MASKARPRTHSLAQGQFARGYSAGCSAGGGSSPDWSPDSGIGTRSSGGCCASSSFTPLSNAASASARRCRSRSAGSPFGVVPNCILLSPPLVVKNSTDTAAYRRGMGRYSFMRPGQHLLPLLDVGDEAASKHRIHEYARPLDLGEHRCPLRLCCPIMTHGFTDNTPMADKTRAANRCQGR